MDSEQFEKLYEEIKAQYAGVAKKEHPDASEEEIEKMADAAVMKELWDMFLDEKISKEDLIAMAGQIGYHPADKFLEDAKQFETLPANDGGEDGGEGALGFSKEQVEEAQGYDDDGEGEDDYEKDDRDYDYEEKEEDEGDEETERKEARKLFDLEDEEEEK